MDLSCIFVCAHVAYTTTPSCINTSLNEALESKQTIATNAYWNSTRARQVSRPQTVSPSHIPQAVTPALLNAGLAEAATPTSSSGSENLGRRYV